MRKFVSQFFIFIVVMFYAPAESLKGLNLSVGYGNNNFEFNNIKYDADYIPVGLGFNYTFYPSYNSFVGFSVNPMLFVNCNVNTSINNPNPPKYALEDGDYYDEEWETSGAEFGFYTDFAVNFRLPLDINKSFFYLRLGGAFQVSSFSAVDKVTYHNTYYYSGRGYEDKYDGSQTTFSTVVEFGWQPRKFYDESDLRTFGFGDISVRFVYDFLTKNPINDEFIFPGTFGIMLVCKPLNFTKEFKKDLRIVSAYEEKEKNDILSFMEQEDKYSKYYKLVENKKCTVGDVAHLKESILNNEKKFGSEIFDIPITVSYYRRTNAYGNVWLKYSEAFIRDIEFTAHTLGNGTLGTKEYTDWKSETIILPFSTDEDKQKAFNAIVAEYECQKQQKAREIKNQDAIFSKAVSSKNINILVKYIDENRSSKYFHDEAYTEIAKLVAKNTKIELKELPYISNPYVLDKNCLYYVSSLPVYQWTGNGSFLAEVGTDKVIFIRNAYDLSKISSGIKNAYLKYVGTYEYTNRYSGVQVVAEFDLVYSFGFFGL